MSVPAVSIVLPLFNGQAHIAGTLHSLAAQTFQDAELVIVDDGGTDGSAALAERICGEGDAPVLRACRIIRQANQGVAAARNAGVAAARAAWIAFVDQDDLWLPQKLSAQMQAVAASAGAAWHYTGFVRFYDDGREVAKLDGSGDRAELLELLVAGELFIPPSAALVRRDVVMALGGFDSAVIPSDDWDFFIKLALRHEPLYLPRCLVRFRSHGGSTGKAQKRRIFAAQEIVLDRHADALSSFVPCRAINRRRSSTWWHMGRECQDEGDRTQALAYYRKALGAAPFRLKIWRSMLSALF